MARINEAALGDVPPPSQRHVAVRVTPAGERALRQRHPWVFEGSIRRQSYEGQPGDLAVLFDRKGRFLAAGLYDPLSPIRVKVLQHGEPATIDGAWFSGRLANALERRETLVATETTGYRLVHGENDGLPGLVVDRYADTLVIKLYTAAWLPHLRQIMDALGPLVSYQRVVLRLARRVAAQPRYLHGLSDGLVLSGPPVEGPILFVENGLTFEADVVHGQKTGFFLDQRDNRSRVEGLASGKDILDLYACTGGFTVYAARGGARSVLSIDLSAPTLLAARRNMSHNDHLATVSAVQHETRVCDAYAALEDLSAKGRRFDLAVIDPPSFAKSSAEVPRALSAYRRLAGLGIDVLRPGGILVMACCSSRVTADAFYWEIHRAAQNTRRSLYECERTAHPPDHPIGFPEGSYLKCLYARLS